MRALLCAALLVVGCRQNQLVPESDDGRPELTMHTGGLWHGPVGARIVGTARGLSGVTVNDHAVDADGEDFAVDIPLEHGVNLIDARGYDPRGDTFFVRQGVLSGQFGFPGDPIQSALTMRVNQSGLDKATELIAGFVDPVTVNEAVAGVNPVYSDTYGALGIDAVEIEANVVDIGFQPVVITPTPKPGVLEIEVVIPFVEVAANATGDVIGIDFDQDVWVGADAAVITANLLVGAQNGVLDVQLVAPTVELEAFWYDLELLPSGIESWLFVETLRNTIEEALVAQVETMVPPLLEDTLQGLDISADTELLGRQVGMRANFDSAFVDSLGLQLTTNVELAVPDDNPHPWIGYLKSPVLAAHPNRHDDIGVSMSDNLVNNLLFQAWRSSLVNLDLDSEAGDIDPSFLSSLGATDAARVQIDALLPPVLVERFDRPQVQITEVQVHIETPNGTRGEFIDAAITAYVDIELRIVNNVMVLSLGETEIVVDVRDSDWGAEEQTITNVLAESLPLDVLLVLLGDIEFPLPSLAGFSIDHAEAGREPNGVHTSIGINL